MPQQKLNADFYMQIAAHYSAAIDILDRILAGEPSERALLQWSRNSRFAGSKDRAAVRDIVFDCLRRQSSFGAVLGVTGRGLVLARAHHVGELELIDGSGYAPAAVNGDELAALKSPIKFSSVAQEFDFPVFLENELVFQFGSDLPKLMEVMRDRAPVDLRVNTLKSTKADVINSLARELVFTEGLDADEDALRIIQNPRKFAGSRAYGYGHVELQDLSSQMVARLAGVKAGDHVLDYCAGGGGKTLAIGAHLAGKGSIDAWDIDARRMKEIPLRAKRAGLDVNVLEKQPSGQYDLVFVDAPCTGSGSWRRTPDAKWRLTPERVDELVKIQGEVLGQAARHVVDGGRLLYATCSVLRRENRAQVDAFLAANPLFALIEDRELSPLNAGDGFYAALMVKSG